MKGWYQAVVDRVLPPARVTPERIKAERVDLYRYVPPLGEKHPVSIDPCPVEDSVTKEEEIERAVKRLRNHLSGGPSRMRSEHIKGWLAEAKKK